MCIQAEWLCLVQGGPSLIGVGGTFSSAAVAAAQKSPSEGSGLVKHQPLSGAVAGPSEGGGLALGTSHQAKLKRQKHAFAAVRTPLLLPLATAQA